MKPTEMTLEQIQALSLEDIREKYSTEDLFDFVGVYPKHYQPDLKEIEVIELYGKLVNEEINELKQATKEKNIVEILDWIVDTLWVYHISCIYGGDILKASINQLFHSEMAELFHYTNEKLLHELLSALIYSNYSKSLELEKDGEKKGKIIKGDNFKPMEPYLQEIIKEHKLELK